MNFIFKPFEQLSVSELYGVLKLRTNVFVVEQNCPYPELDDKDLTAIHVFCSGKDAVLATGRILPPGISYKEWSFGRIATHIEIRGTGAGKKLMSAMMNYMSENHPIESIRISAQSHLEKFYGNFGFRYTGKKYLEDGIPHVEMLFAPSLA